MAGIEITSNTKYGNYEVIKTTPSTTEQEKSAFGLIENGTTKDNVLDLTNPDKLIAELTQDKVKFIKVSDGLYLKLDLTNKNTATKLLADLKQSIAKETNLSKDFSPLVFEKALGLKTTPANTFLTQNPEKTANLKYNEIFMAGSRVKDIDFYAQKLGELADKTAGDSEYLLENPETSDKDLKADITQVRDSLSSLTSSYKRDLFSDTGAYGIKSQQREIEYASEPGLKVVEALNNLLPKDFQPGQVIPVQKLAEIEALIEKVDKKSPEYEKLTQLINNLKPVIESLGFASRIFPHSFSNESVTVKKAGELAKENPDKAYGVVDAGKSKGYQIVEYTAAQAAVKLAGVENSNGGLVAFLVNENGKINMASRLADKKIADGTLSDDFRSVIADKSVKVDPNALGDKDRENGILNKVADKAVEVVVKQYDAALKRYENWTTDYPQNPPPGNTDPNFVTVDKSDLVNLVNQLGKSGRRDLEDQVAQLFKVERRATGTDLRAAQISNFHDKYVAASTRDEKLAVISEYKDLFNSLKASVGKCIPKIQEEKDKLVHGDKPEIGFTVLKDYPTVRQEVYRQSGFNLDLNKFPPVKAADLPTNSLTKFAETVYKENPQVFTSTSELVFSCRAEKWDKSDKMIRGAVTAGTVAGSVLLTVLTEIPPVWLAAGAAAVGSGIEIADAKHDVDKTRVKNYGGFASEKEMKDADIKFGISIISGVLNVGTGAFSAGLAPTSILKGLGRDLMLNLAQTGIDPKTYYGANTPAEVFARIKDSMQTTVIMGGTLSAIHVASGKVRDKIGEKLAQFQGKSIEAKINSENGEMLIKPKGSPDSEGIKIPKENINKADGKKLEFKLPGSDATANIEIDSMKVGFKKKEGVELTDSSPTLAGKVQPVQGSAPESIVENSYSIPVKLYTPEEIKQAMKVPEAHTVPVEAKEVYNGSVDNAAENPVIIDVAHKYIDKTYDQMASFNEFIDFYNKAKVVNPKITPEGALVSYKEYTSKEKITTGHQLDSYDGSQCVGQAQKVVEELKGHGIDAYVVASAFEARKANEPREFGHAAAMIKTNDGGFVILDPGLNFGEPIKIKPGEITTVKNGKSTFDFELGSEGIINVKRTTPGKAETDPTVVEKSTFRTDKFANADTALTQPGLQLQTVLKVASRDNKGNPQAVLTVDLNTGSVIVAFQGKKLAAPINFKDIIDSKGKNLDDIITDNFATILGQDKIAAQKSMSPGEFLKKRIMDVIENKKDFEAIRKTYAESR